MKEEEEEKEKQEKEKQEEQKLGDLHDPALWFANQRKVDKGLRYRYVE